MWAAHPPNPRTLLIVLEIVSQVAQAGLELVL